MSSILERPVGIYDSGIGGLTVLSHFLTRFPRERFVYCADAAHLPYGEKTPLQLVEYATDILSWMQNEKGVKGVILACHTSSALALEEVAPLLSIPIVGTITPIVGKVAAHKRVGILATPAAATHRGHEKVFMRHGFRGALLSVGCPRFVPLIEAGAWESEALRESAERYLLPLHEFHPELLVYGCTHYPWIRPLIEQLLPPETIHLDPAEYIAHEAAPWLDSRAPSTPEEWGGVEFYTTGDCAAFEGQVRRLLYREEEPLLTGGQAISRGGPRPCAFHFAKI